MSLNISFQIYVNGEVLQNMMSFLSRRDVMKLGCVDTKFFQVLTEYKRLRLGKCMLSENEMLFDIGDILQATIKRPVNIYTMNPFPSSGIICAWPYEVFSTRYAIDEKEGIAVHGNFQDVDGVRIFLNIRPELALLVEGGSYEAYAIGMHNKKSSGTYENGLANLFKKFREHLDLEQDAKEAEEDKVLHEQLQGSMEQFQQEEYFHDVDDENEGEY